MLIAIDIDDVLVDFITGLTKFHNETYGTSLTKDEFHSYSLWEVWGGTREGATQKVGDYKKTEAHHNIKPFLGAIEVVNTLKQNHELVVITSRFKTENTLRWINEHFPNVFSEIYFTYNHYTKRGDNKTKADICLELGAEIMIEDSLEYAKECANNGIRILLFDQPWNKCEELPENVIRINNWKEVLDNI